MSSLFHRRQLLQLSGGGLGWALARHFLSQSAFAEEKDALPHFPPQAKRVIFLCQSGGPSQVDLFDPKPELARRHGEEMPKSVRMGQRLTTMTSDQEKKPLTSSLFKFTPHGECGMELSDLLPHTAKAADDICLLRSVHTDAINHDPGITLLQTGSQQPGRPSMGSWLSFALGSENAELPAFVVLVSGGQPGDQPLYNRLWGTGFLPSQHAGVRFRGAGDPILYLRNPAGISAAARQRMVDGVTQLNELEFSLTGDAEIPSRNAQYRKAIGLQQSLPELVNVAKEPDRIFDLYGEDARTPGTYAANCLLARRLVEQDVRFVQLYHRGWDHHLQLPEKLRRKCRETDQASAALVADLKQRDLLRDTLILWAGEFGRTSFCQGDLTVDDYGRDHHPRCFSLWLAGGGVKAGHVFGRTDDFSYNVAENPLHIHDLHATLLYLLGIDHTRLTFRHEGRDHRLTDIAGRVEKGILA